MTPAQAAARRLYESTPRDRIRTHQQRSADDRRGYATEITDELVARYRQMKADGAFYRNIRRALNVSSDAMSRIAKRAAESPNQPPRKKTNEVNRPGRLLRAAGKTPSRICCARITASRATPSRHRSKTASSRCFVSRATSSTVAAKDTPLERLGGITPRRLMTSLGTDWGRNMIGDDLWLRMADYWLQLQRRFSARVVILDVRFENEAAMDPAPGRRDMAPPPRQSPGARGARCARKRARRLHAARR
jgi:hypothetical protein